MPWIPSLGAAVSRIPSSDEMDTDSCWEQVFCLGYGQYDERSRKSEVLCTAGDSDE